MPPFQGDRPDPSVEQISMAPSNEAKVKDAHKVKCVLVGDGATGKTSLILSYSSNAFPTEYVPTAYDTYTVDVNVDNQPVRLDLCDTAGQDDFDNLRPLCYPGTDVFILCFSVMNPTSFHNIGEKWAPELSKSYPQAPTILVGTLSDLRGDVRELIQLDKYDERPVSEEEAESRARDVGALQYVECSALTQKNVKEVFDLAILAALDRKGVLASPCKSGKSSASSGSGSKRWKKYKQRHTLSAPSASSLNNATAASGHQAGTATALPAHAAATSSHQTSHNGGTRHKHADTDMSLTAGGDTNANNTWGSALDVKAQPHRQDSSGEGRGAKKKGWKKFCCFV